MTIPKIRENAVEAFQSHFDFETYSFLSNDFNCAVRFIDVQYLIEFLFAISPEAYQEYKKGLYEVRKFVTDKTMSLVDFSSIDFSKVTGTI